MKINHSSYNLGVLANNNENLSEIKIGQMIKGKIQQIINDVLILEMSNGELLEAKTTTPLEAQINDHLKFQVKSIHENQIILQPLMEESTHKEKTDTADNKISNLLKELNIKPGEEEIALVKKLIANEIPANKDNLANIIQLKSNFDKLEALLNTKSIIINEKIMNENIKEVLKDILQAEDPMKENEYNKNENVKDIVEDVHTLESQKNVSENTKHEINYEKSHNAKDINIHHMNFEKIIFLLKNNLKVNMTNVTNMNNLILKDFTITSQMDQLTASLYKNEETVHFGKSLDQLFSDIKNMIFEKKFEPQEIMKELYIKLELVKQSVENSNSKDKGDILKHITNLKNGLDFMNKLNQFQNYFQVPIFLNDERKNLELFISKDHKNKKKINPKDVKILVALDTKTMDQIQVLIEIKDNHIGCNFKVTNDEIKKKLVTFEDSLKGTLELLGFKGIHTKYVVANIEKNMIEEVFDKKEMTKKMRFIDLKV